MYHGQYITAMELVILGKRQLVLPLLLVLPLFPNDSKSVAMIKHSM